MVSGKIRRMKLTRNGDQKPTMRPEMPPRPAPKPRPPPPEPKTTLIIAAPVSIADREQGQCCAILDIRDKRGLSMMCGNKTYLRSPWCKGHHELFYDHERGKLHGQSRHSN
jgi:hypothetical protein